jgi:hypothetical protein
MANGRRAASAEPASLDQARGTGPAERPASADHS